jgi:hypothetical protein
MSIPTSRGNSARVWQYHSRSDTHSKVACWGLLFDLLRECDIFRQHAQERRIGFGINHVMVGPINKTLDLVVTRVPSDRRLRRRVTFSDLASRYGIALDADDRAELGRLPSIEMDDAKEDISEVAIALEAKACMTEHSKSLPRLHAEILATGYLAKQAQPRCITVSLSMVNAAQSFATPSGEAKVNTHTQPEDAEKVVDMLRRAIPLARAAGGIGYDLVAAIVVDCRNDGSEVKLITSRPAPDIDSHINYGRMVVGLCGEYRARFGQ